MVIQEGYKQTEVGVIPEDWEVLVLANVLTVKHGKDQKLVLSNNGKYPILGSGGILGYSNRYLYDLESVLIGRKGTIDRPYFMDTPFWTVDTLFYTEIRKSFLPKFIFYMFNLIDWYSYNEASGVPSLNAKTIERIKISLPPLPEQTAIAEVLTDTDNLIQALEKQIAKKRLIKQGVMQELLTPKEGWVVKKLGEVATFRRGSFPQPYGLDKWYDDNSGYPFIQVYDVDENKKLKPFTKRHISKEAQPYSVFVKKGSIVLTIQGSIGRIAITQYDAYVDRTLLIFEEFKVNFNNFFFMLLIFILFEKEKQIAPGGIIKTITKAALTNFEIFYPESITEQTYIATTISDIDEDIFALEVKLKKFKILKHGLMQQLLTGKIRLIKTS